MRRRRPALLCAAVLAGAAAAAIVAAAAAPGSSVPHAFEATSGSHVTVSALPGRDLAPLTRLPGLAASSGPYPSFVTGASLGRRTADVTLEARGPHGSAVERPLVVSGTWVRPGAVVLDQGLARALGAGAGDDVSFPARRGPARLRVAGVAISTSRAGLDGRTGIAWVTRPTLARIAPSPRVLGSTLYLRLSQPGRSGAYAAWLRRRYPGPQVTVDDWQRLESASGAGPALIRIAALLGLAAIAAAAGRGRAGTRPRMRPGVARRA
jgi:putative ABC transport system permease protein